MKEDKDETDNDHEATDHPEDPERLGLCPFFFAQSLIQGGDVDGARENRPRRDRGDGERRPRRDGERRPRREGEGGPRRFDRKSGDPRSSYKVTSPLLDPLNRLQGSDKREGAGQGNWGTEKDELKGQTEAVTEERPSEEKTEGEAAPEVEAAAPAPVEEEDKTMTLEEYKKQKKNVIKNSNARTAAASEETDQKEVSAFLLDPSTHR